MARHYADAQLWADDVAAVIDQLDLDRPVLVAWSYGGYIVTDYVRVHGEDAVAGIDLVGAAVMLRPTFDHLGPGLLDNAENACSPDVLEVCGSAEASWYDGVGHMPFLEDPARFDRELGQFVARVR